MGNGYVRQSAADIVTGNTILPVHLNNEFNSLRDAFDGTNGHSHDGTTGEGQKIDLKAAVTNVLEVVNGGTNATTPADARSNLGLAIGTNVQAQNAALQSISGLTTAANQTLYTTAPNVYATTALTPFVRTLLDDADAAAFKTTLALQNVDNTSDANKPVSSATQTALNTKMDKAGGQFTNTVTFAPSTANNSSFVIPAGSATPTGGALVDGAVWADGSKINTRLGGATRSLLTDAPATIANANLADMAANTVKGRLSSTGVPTDLTFAQLLQGFGTFINGSTSGYVRIPVTDSNGTIINFYIQWGIATGGGDVAVTFPITFPNSLFAVNSTQDAGGTVPGNVLYADFVRSITTSSMVIGRRAVTGSGPVGSNLPSLWIALGY